MNNIYHVIKDPVHGTMQFTSLEDAWVKPFIDSQHFQRLRHIKQLGLGDFIFPGAMHSRFNHCLGCCYVASQIAIKIGLTQAERQLVMIASLLHDIGHGPFSHAFEGIFSNKLIRHEDWTPYFLADYETHDFFAQYNQINPRHQLTEENFHAIAEMIMHKTTEKNVLADIVSSQLDADRLDYLLRDSHFCGVRYGEFDFRWMLHCMAIVESKGSKRLGITHKGIGVVEHYLMARRLMTRNIYHLQKKLALEEYLIQLLARLAESMDAHQAFAQIAQTRLGQFLLAANQINHVDMQDKNLINKKQEFLHDNFAHYKELMDYDVFSLIKNLAAMHDSHSCVKIAVRIQQRQMPKIFRFDYAYFPQVEAELQEFKVKHKNLFEDWQLSIIHTPHRSYSGEEDPILVVDDQGSVRPIEDYSLMLNAISDQFEHGAFLSIDKLIAEDHRVVALMKSLKKLPLEA